MNRIIFSFFFLGFVNVFPDEVGVNQDDQRSEAPTEVPTAFSLGPHSFNSAYSLYASAGTPGAQDYTIFALDGLGTRPIAKEKITLNHKKEQTNPFYNKKINLLYTIYNNPLLIADDKPSDIYYVAQQANPEQPMSVLSVSDIHDANGNISNGIVNLGFYQTVTAERQHTYILCAVKKQDGNFGDYGSGIALVKFGSREITTEQDEEDKEQKSDNTEQDAKKTDADQKEFKTFLTTMDAREGIIGGNKAFPLDLKPMEKDLVQINGGLDFIQSNAVDIFLDENFNRFYVALQIKTKDNAAPNQGACALLVGRVWEDKLFLDPIVSSSVFSSDANNIIGAVGPGRFVSLHKVTVMHSTSGLPYLIVVGGNGKPEETNKAVYALPLANRSGKSNSLEQRIMDKGHGSIAKKHLLPGYQFFPGRYGRLKSRILDEVAIDEKEFYSDSDAAVRVGGESQLPNAVKQIFAARDIVAVLVDQDGDGQEAGVFYSQAIFDQNGCIAAWSSWKKIPGSNPSITGMSIDPHKFHFTFFDTANQLSIRFCQWKYSAIIKNDKVKEPESKSLPYILQEELPQKIGGIQGLFDFDYATPGLSGSQKSSLLIATGNQKIVLVQTACDDEKGILRARRSFSKNAESIDGNLTNIVPGGNEVISISGGVLDDLGPISCATIINDWQQAWLVVGGVGGVAVLADENGNGWPLQDGLGTNFSNLASSFYFHKLGEYQFVQKLVGLDGYFYFLTQDTLDCIVSCPEMIKHTVKPQTLATQQELGGYFTDAAISHGCVLLATGCGLFFGGEDIVTQPGKITWEKIELPGASQAVPKLFCVTPTGNESDFVKNSQIYVLSGSIAHAEAEVYRLFVHDGQIQLVKDFAYKDHPSRFISFGAFRDNFATDGLTHISTRASGWPLTHVLPAFVGGKLIASSKGYVVPIDAQIFSIRQIVKNSATGSWLIGGDFGVCIHE